MDAHLVPCSVLATSTRSTAPSTHCDDTVRIGPQESSIFFCAE